MVTQKLKNWTTVFDWGLLLLVLSISAIGVLNLKSAEGVLPQPLHVTQMLWLGLGMGLAVAVSIIDYRTFERWAYVIYGGIVFMLLLVLLVGTNINGSQRWLVLGTIHVQPSELMKFGVIISVARYFHERDKRDSYSLPDLVVPFLLVALPASLVIQQPDLGTSILLFMLAITIALFEGIKTGSIVLLAACLMAFTPIAWFGGLLKDYQKDRILTFLQVDGEEEALGRDWQVNQSVIAVGAGGLHGKGFTRGTQIQKGFVPEPENDFALANWAEEQGFVGASFLLLLYLGLMLWALRIARTARDKFGMLCAVGVAATIFWQVLINYGMVLRVMPVVGITLPLVSYGGSSVITVMLSLGLLMNISIRRHVYKI